jgi:hypothetical protein
MIGLALAVLVLVLGVPIALMGEEPRWGIALTAVAFVAGVVASIALFITYMNTCDADGGVVVPASCPVLLVTMSLAPVPFAAGAAGAYVARRPWPLMAGLALGVALVLVSRALVGA